jgi:glutathione S-transferase
MPRPDISALGVAYRRIPILSIGRDIYLDTRLILQKLETLFPPSPSHPTLSPNSNSSSQATQATITKLLEHYAIDAGLFARAAALIPTSMPLLKDPKFTKDREDFTGRSWSAENVERGRPEALVEIKSAFEFFENTMLADGREWVLGGEGVSLADIEAVWLFSWLVGLRGALEGGGIGREGFPRTWAWVERFEGVVKEVMRGNGKVGKVGGKEAVKEIGEAEWAEKEASVDEGDPSGLKKGEMVELWPIDSGFNRKDRGRLVGLSTREVVIEGRTEEGKEVRIHAPRHGFRVRRAKEAGKL